MFSKVEVEEISEYLSRVEGKVYIGCDSVVQRRYNLKAKAYEMWARYAVVLVVHIDNSRGCKIFSYADRERVYDKRKNRPSMRLMAEVYKSVDCYINLSDLGVLNGREVEIHIDVNPSAEHASNRVVKQAIGYVKGVTTLNPLIKPDAWAGSSTADYMAKRKSV